MIYIKATNILPSKQSIKKKARKTEITHLSNLKPNQKYIVHFKEEKKRNIYMGFFNPIKNVIKGKN